MRLLSTTTFSMLAFATAATAQTTPDYSSMIAQNGLAQTATALANNPDPTPSDQFALGGVQFLRAIERTLQTRYTYGVNDEIAEILDLPLLRLPIFDNPTPEPFTPSVIETLLAEALVDFEDALSALDTITDADAVAVTIRTDDLWFDVNLNNARDPGEGLFAILSGEPDPVLAAETAITVQFDTADAAWLSAYAHVLSGVSEVMLALDPAKAIETVLEGAAHLATFQDGTTTGGSIFTPNDGTIADAIAIAVHAIEGVPDVTRSRAAHAHFLSMIEDNKVFWARVAQETDNAQEWIPNKRQTSALPITFPPETGQTWRGVLHDAEALLTGEVLLPHWRLGGAAGLNLAEMMQDPPDLDIIGIIQGHTVAPYVAYGRLIDSDNLRAFEELVGGDAPLFMILLN